MEFFCNWRVCSLWTGPCNGVQGSNFRRSFFCLKKNAFKLFTTKPCNICSVLRRQAEHFLITATALLCAAVWPSSSFTTGSLTLLNCWNFTKTDILTLCLLPFFFISTKLYRFWFSILCYALCWHFFTPYISTLRYTGRVAPKPWNNQNYLLDDAPTSPMLCLSWMQFWEFVPTTTNYPDVWPQSNFWLQRDL